MNKQQFLQAYKKKKNPDLANFVSSFTESEVLELMEAWNTHVREKEDNFLCKDEPRCETQCLRCIESNF